MVKLLITKPFDQQNNLDITDSGNRFCLLTLHWLLKYAHSCVRPVVSASQILSVARGCGPDWTCIYEKKAQEVYTMLSCGAGGHVMSRLEALFGKVVGPLGSGSHWDQWVTIGWGGFWGFIVSSYFLLTPCFLRVDAVWPASLLDLLPCVLHHEGLIPSSTVSQNKLFSLKLLLSGYFITAIESKTDITLLCEEMYCNCRGAGWRGKDLEVLYSHWQACVCD